MARCTKSGALLTATGLAATLVLMQCASRRAHEAPPAPPATAAAQVVEDAPPERPPAPAAPSEPASARMVEEGIASWYGPGFDGKETANGEVYDEDALTAAHPTLPFDTRVRVTRLSTGRSVVVRINDRGPEFDPRIIDLSRAAGRAIGLIRPGTAKVRLDLLE